MWRRLVAWWPFMLVRTHRQAQARWDLERADLRLGYQKKFAARVKKMDAVFDEFSSLRVTQARDRIVTLSMSVDERLLSRDQQEREFVAEIFARYIQCHFERLVVVGRR
jgi:hypothetical protein